MVTWYCTQAVAKGVDCCQTERLNIEYCGQLCVWTGNPGVVHSAAAKAGVLAMSRTLAVEWGSKYE